MTRAILLFTLASIVIAAPEPRSTGGLIVFAFGVGVLSAVTAGLFQTLETE